MAESINFNKTLYRKQNYTKTIDTSFKELGIKSVQEQIDEQPTIQEFFNMYNTLFYDINEFGGNDSHEYLIKTSGQYVGATAPNDETQLLLDEITSLRQQLLAANQQVINLQISSSLNL